jgi:integrase
MASISTDKSGNRRILYVDENRKRRVLYIGKVSERDAEGVQRRVESMLAARILGDAIDRDDARWLSESPPIREKLERLDLIPSGKIQIDRRCMSMEEFLDDYIERHGASRKPATVAVWKQVVANLKEYMPEGIRINQITAGHAKEFHEKLKARGMATTTIHKRIQFARQFMHDAVDWKIIDENPFCKVKTQKSSVKVNEFVLREVVDKLIKKANPVWQVILGLSRYGGLRTPSETLSLRWEDIDWEMNRMSIPEPKVEHHEGRGIRSCPIFPELRPILDEAFEIFTTRANTWSRLPSTALLLTRRLVG